jgi:HTH-type transcriptional regulator/antitoxin HigA
LIFSMRRNNLPAERPMTGDNHKTPGQFINFLLTERGWTKRTLSAVVGMDESKINRLTSDKQPVTAEIALLLEDAFGVKAEEFLDYQKHYDLAIARITARPNPQRTAKANLYSSIPVSDMIKRGWLDAKDVKDPNVENEISRFFGKNRIEDVEVLSHAAKKTKACDGPTPTQLAWLFRVRQIASEMHPPLYSRSKLSETIEKMKDFRREVVDVRHVPRLLNECGVRFVVVEGLPGGGIDGVCFWLDERSPVIGLSMRYDRIDNFWFVLVHECSHVIHGHGRGQAILDDLATVADSVNEEERIANAEAADFCVPQDQIKSFYLRKKPFFAEIDVLAFAKRIKVHPGIAVGQLQRISNQYDLHRKHLVKVRSCLAGSMMMDGWGNIVPVGR